MKLKDGGNSILQEIEVLITSETIVAAKSDPFAHPIFKYAESKEEDKADDSDSLSTASDRCRIQHKNFKKLEIMRVLMEQYTKSSKMMDKVKDLSPFSVPLSLSVPGNYTVLQQQALIPG